MTQRIVVLSATLTTISLFCFAVTRAQITETKLTASDGESSDFFGGSVSLFGNYALIGAPQDGSAYIFHFDGSDWVEQGKLLASDGAPLDHFGVSVSLSGDHAIVGAHWDDDNGSNSGSAYIFHFDGLSWVEQAKLLASDGDADDHFGASVSLSGDYALVGAWHDEENGGSAYIFHFDGLSWAEQAKLLASDGDGHFGHSVSLSGDNALVGAFGGTASNGSAHIFHYDGADWMERSKLLASDGRNEDYFGYSVSLSGDNALVGAVGGNGTGLAYIFHYDGTNWMEQSRLRAGDGELNDLFGTSVSLSGNYAIVGARWDDGNYSDAGSAYIFHFDGSNWVIQTKVTAGDGEGGDYFGTSVSISGNYALVGAQNDDDIGYDAGAAYIYSASPLCSKVSQFQARCRSGGLIKARVIMADASHAGDIVEISIDDVPYQVTIDANGRGQLSQGGFSSGPHTVELTNPGQCFDPIVVTCRTSLDEEASDDWDDELVSEPPTETALLGNYPNPFNPSTTIRYTLSVDSPVSIRVYNMLGQEVATLVDGFQKAGEQSVVWHGTNNFGQAVASGLYICRLHAGSMVMSQKMLFAK